MSDEDTENESEEELQEMNEQQNNMDAPPMGDHEQSHDIHTDDDYDTDRSMVENDHDDDEDYDGVGGLPMGQGHRRTGSLAEKRETIAQQKAAMEQKLRTLSQQLDQGLDTALDEFAEMEQINEDKTVFGDLFDKIDPEDNGDVDEKEWIGGMKRLNVAISEDDMSKLFKLMDGDKSGYIDRQDWITFCMTSYNSKELQRLHDAVLSNIKGHSRKPSNMFHAEDVQNWSASAVTNLTKQMTQAFLKQGNEVIQQQEEEEEYFVDMEQQAANNPDWAKPERALDWTPKEVAFWLDSIELSQYARKFDDEQLDGSILLNDCDKNMLQIEMGIKPLHVGKILREVDKLRKVNKDELQDSYKDWNELIEENKMLIAKLEDQQRENQKLEAENAELRLKSMSGANNLHSVANPMGADDALIDGVRTTQGLDLEVEDGISTEFKTDQIDPFTEIKLLQSEIEHLHQQKIQFAERTATEILKLNRIIKVLSKEYTTLTTPYYKKFNPIDSIIRSLGYTPTQK